MNINATLIVQMLVFFLGAWVTMKYIWPPINKAIEERQAKIAEGLAAADKGELALQEAKKQGLTIEQQAREQSQVIVAQGEKRAQAIIDAAKDQAQVEADKIIASAREQAAQEIQQAREQLRDQVANLAVQGASQILGKEVDEKAHQQILDKFKASL
ncbi:MAG: F0F1 ATP synthase subunit B [Burkholderiales bacterium]|nr:F0F1 ATP synthase subunit B [Burkholderiales bacterium]